ncbi:MAG: hypothetical protein ACI8QC_000871 [Planctomycetota bacterium]|jgi:hypothetical protein
MHPAGASLFMQVPDVPALIEAYKQSAYGQLVGDTDLRGAIARVMGQDSFDPMGLIMEWWDAAEESGEIPQIRPLLTSIRGISFSMSLAGHDLAAFVETANALSGKEQEAAIAGMLGLDLVVEFADQQFAGQAIGLLTESLGPDAEKLQASTIEGPGGNITQWAVDGATGMGATIRIFQAGSRLMLHTGIQGLATAPERIAGTGASIAERMGELGASLPKAGGQAVFELHNQIGDQVLDLIEAETGEIGVIGMAVQLLEAAGGPGFTMMLRNGAWRLSAEDGRFTTNGVHLARDESILDSAIGATNLTEEGLSLVHPEAIAGGLVSIDSDKLTSWMTEILGGEGQEKLTQFSESYGFNPITDLIEPLGSAGAWSLKSSIGLGAPPFQLMVAVGEPEAMRRGLAGLARLLPDAVGEGASIKSRPYRGYDVYTVRFNSEGMDLGDLPINPLDLFQPTFVVMDDRLIVTVNSIQAKREIKRILKGESALHPALAGELFPEGGAGQVGFANWIEVVGRLYSAAKSLAPIIAGGMAAEGELPFDLTVLPDAELFTRHFETSYEWKRRDGALVRYYGESSFGPESNGIALVPFIGLAATMVAPSPATLSDAEFEAVNEEALDVSDAPQPVDGGGER